MPWLRSGHPNKARNKLIENPSDNFLDSEAIVYGIS
jgi:hypothetical protein